MTQPNPPHQGRLLVALLGGMFLGSVDIAIVNVATPSIREHLGASGAEVELIVSGYTLTYAMLLVTSARLGTTHGLRKVYAAGLAIFTLSSLACGLAPTAGVLLAARVVQGAGAALCTSQVLTGIQLYFEGSARARAIGLYTAVLSTSAVLGQVLGGVLISADLFGLSWRPAFLLNVPIGVVLYVLAWRNLPAHDSRDGKRLDLPGVAVLSAALLLLVLPLVLGRESGWPAWTWASLAASVVAFIGFVRVERRQSERGGLPLVTLSLLGQRPVAFALLSQAATVATYFGLLFTLALYLQQGLGKSAAVSGLSLVSWVAAFGIAGPVLGRLRVETRKRAAPLGRIVLAAAFAAIFLSLALGQADNEALLITLLGIGGLGYGAGFSGTLTLLTSSVTGEYAAEVSGLFNTTIQVGGSLGVAVFGTVYLDLALNADRSSAIHAFTTLTALLAATVAVAAVLAQVALSRPRTSADSPAVPDASAHR
ncbi:MFS transporter [Streptomyces sp. NPDC046985]|uniref:MFS transporter n=1 Tax=Streptomyces sp. NPDC046985 TaxID=3155377 RepID=UPI0034100048